MLHPSVVAVYHEVGSMAAAACRVSTGCPLLLMVTLLFTGQLTVSLKSDESTVSLESIQMAIHLTGRKRLFLIR